MKKTVGLSSATRRDDWRRRMGTTLVLAFLIPFLLAACSARTEAAPTPAVSATSLLPVASNSSTSTPDQPSVSSTPADTPTPQPSATPAPPLVTLYNRYVGKDTARQPDLIQSPPGPIIPIREADGYASSYIQVFLGGKQVNGDEILGDPTMLAHLILLFNDAHQQLQASVTVLSSYRSYDDQLYLYQTQTEEADHFLAEPGRSEHQLGTAVDLAWNAERLNFYLMNVYPQARIFYNWLKENAHHYGFVFSYPYKSTPDQKTDNILVPYVTEYKAEPWHIRYVGVDLASKIYAAQDDQGRNYLDPLSALIPQQFLSPPPTGK